MRVVSTEPDRRSDLQAQLVEVIRRALPDVHNVSDALQAADRSYAVIAGVLVALRHEFHGPDGSPDLRGRSRGYRRLVRTAYEQAGVARKDPLEKRLTVGVAYWVRKLLVERYGERALREWGVIPDASAASVVSRSLGAMAARRDASACFMAMVEILNQLATDPVFVPSEDLVRSAARAIALLHRRTRPGPATTPQPDSASLRSRRAS